MGDMNGLSRWEEHESGAESDADIGVQTTCWVDAFPLTLARRSPDPITSPHPLTLSLALTLTLSLALTP